MRVRAMFASRGFALLLALAIPGPAVAQERVIPSSRDEVMLSFAPVVKKAAPAVVNIYTKKVVRQRAVAPGSGYRTPWARV